MVFQKIHFTDFFERKWGWPHDFRIRACIDFQCESQHFCMNARARFCARWPHFRTGSGAARTAEVSRSLPFQPGARFTFCIYICISMRQHRYIPCMNVYMPTRIRTVISTGLSTRMLTCGHTHIHSFSQRCAPSQPHLDTYTHMHTDRHTPFQPVTCTRIQPGMQSCTHTMWYASTRAGMRACL